MVVPKRRWTATDCVHHIMLSLSGLDPIGYALLQRNIAQTSLETPLVKASSHILNTDWPPTPVFTVWTESSIPIDARKQKIGDILHDSESYKERYSRHSPCTQSVSWREYTMLVKRFSKRYAIMAKEKLWGRK